MVAGEGKGGSCEVEGAVRCDMILPLSRGAITKMAKMSLITCAVVCPHPPTRLLPRHDQMAYLIALAAATPFRVLCERGGSVAGEV